MMELDGVAPPEAPRRGVERPVVGARLNPHIAAWVRSQADVDRCTVSEWLTRLIVKARDGDALPADCRDWLARQAAQCGKLGDPDGALVVILRHLADRYPSGVRL